MHSSRFASSARHSCSYNLPGKLWKSLAKHRGTALLEKKFLIDVKTVAMVDSTGALGERWNATTNQAGNPGLVNAKYKKHEMA